MVLSGKTEEAVGDKKREAAFTTENCNFIASTFASGNIPEEADKMLS